jgi:hypothetical protein
MQVPELGSGAAKVRTQMRQQETEPETAEAVTAFLVYITPEGRVIMDANLDAPVTALRPPSRHEIIGACRNVANDVARQMQTEEVTMNILGNLSRMQADPNYQAMVAEAQAQARAAAAAASGNR